MPFFSSFYSSAETTAGGAVKPWIGNQLWKAIGDAFEPLSSAMAPAVEMEEYVPGRPIIEPLEPEFPKLPKSGDIFEHITEKYKPGIEDPLEELDMDFGGLRPPPEDIMNEFEALNLDKTFAEAMELNSKSLALRQTLSDIIGTPIPDAYAVLKAQREAAGALGEDAAGFQDMYDTIYKRPMPLDAPIATAEEKGLAAALLNNREAVINRAFFDGKVDPWLAEPGMAEDFAAGVPLEAPGPMEAPSIWQRIKKMIWVL